MIQFSSLFIVGVTLVDIISLIRATIEISR